MANCGPEGGAGAKAGAEVEAAPPKFMRELRRRGALVVSAVAAVVGSEDRASPESPGCMTTVPVSCPLAPAPPAAAWAAASAPSASAAMSSTLALFAPLRWGLSRLRGGREGRAAHSVGTGWLVRFPPLGPVRRPYFGPTHGSAQSHIAGGRESTRGAR